MESMTVALLEDRPDALASVVALLHRRAFRLSSFTFGPSERPGVVRLTLGVWSADGDVERLLKELHRSVHVLAAESLAEVSSVERELMLIKVAAEDHQQAEIRHLAQAFRANPVDWTPTTLSLEVTGSSRKLDALLPLLRPFGILEMARTGPLAMARGEISVGAGEHHTSWLERHGDPTSTFENPRTGDKTPDTSI